MYCAHLFPYSVLDCPHSWAAISINTNIEGWTCSAEALVAMLQFSIGHGNTAHTLNDVPHTNITATSLSPYR